MKLLSHLRYFFSQRETAVIGLVFSFNSFLFGNWVTRIPDVKEQIGLTDTELGLALLGAPMGGMVLMPITGWIIAKLGLGRATLIGTLLHILSPAFLSMADSFTGLVIGMVYFGLTNAVMDVAMNATSAATEKKLKRPIMSTCHGMWSFGAMVGSATGSVFLGLGTSVIAHLCGMVLLIVISTIALSTTIVRYKEAQGSQDKLFTVPNLALMGLAVMAFCIMLSEGAIADWSAIYMKETLLSSPYLVGLAYSSYSLLMAGGRFAGDIIILKIGKKRTVILGSLVSVISLGITLIIADP